MDTLYALNTELILGHDGKTDFDLIISESSPNLLIKENKAMFLSKEKRKRILLIINIMRGCPVKAIRYSLNISQERLADHLKINCRSLKRIEANNTNPGSQFTTQMLAIGLAQGFAIKIQGNI